VGAEVAIAVVLLCGATLLIRSFVAMHAVSLGFEPHNLLTMEVSLAGPGYAKSSAVDRLGRGFVSRTETIPGVESAALASALPLSGRQDMLFDIPGRTPLDGHKFTGDVQWRIVSPHYFDVLRIPLISGRLLQEREPGRTVVISQAMAHEYWPNSNPVGQTIVIGPGLGPEYEAGATEIAGVVGDVRERLDIGPNPHHVPSAIPSSRRSNGAGEPVRYTRHPGSHAAGCRAHEHQPDGSGCAVGNRSTGDEEYAHHRSGGPGLDGETKLQSSVARVIRSHGALAGGSGYLRRDVL